MTMSHLRIKDPSQSELNSPLIIIPNKDASVCFFVDFWKDIYVSKCYAYPVPRMDELLENWPSSVCYYT